MVLLNMNMSLGLRLELNPWLNILVNFILLIPLGIEGIEHIKPFFQGRRQNIKPGETF